MPNDLLTTLPPHILTHITGDRRRRLIEYLLRWDEAAAALACLDHWLEVQPHLVTLREAAARTQLELGQPATALVALDEIDAERGMSESRRAIRARALAALGRWDAAHALLDARPADHSTWRLRAELLIQQGRLDQAAEACARAAASLPEDSPPLRTLAELALARGDIDRARVLLLQRQAARRDAPPDPRDLVLLRTIAARAGDADALTALDAQIHERRASECATLSAELGLHVETETDALAHPLTLSPLHPLTQEPDLPAEALAALRDHFGYDTFRPGQAAVIERVLRGEPALAVLPTGAGKSLTYQLPALLLPGATLVLSPLIALMKDQIDNLPPALAARSTTIHSGLDAAQVAERLHGVAAGRYKLVYAAPERLRQQPFIHALRRAGLSRVVVDEAHCVSLWGISFRPDYLFIRRALDALGSPPLLALTATATPDTEAEIKAHLGEMPTIRASIFRPNLRFEVTHAPNRRAKLAAVAALCQEIAGPVVVYVRSRDGCEEVAAHLREKGVAAEHYHAQVADRAAVQDRFMRGATRVLVATVAFGMGVDKADVRAIIHFNLPQSVEAYYQEAGRAGRDGQPARCVLLYAPSDKGQLTAWLREEALSRGYLREVYRWLRQRISGTWSMVALDDLRRDLREADETRMRVALGLLERVGLVARHFDLPRAATLLLPGDPTGDRDFRAFLQAARLRPGQPLDVDLLALAARCQCTPDELERRLLRWQDERLLRYEGSARDVLLELRAAPADIGVRIDALLAEYAARQDARVEAIAAYARGVTCRHHAIAAHFGERLANCRAACDICAPTGAADPRATRNNSASKAELHPSPIANRPSPVIHRPPPIITQAILEAVAELPGRLSDKDLACVLRGEPGYPVCAAFGRLAGVDFTAIREAAAALVASKKLAYRSRALVLVASEERPASPDAVAAVVLRCLTRLPFAVGKSGLAKVLKGAAGSPVGPERCADYAALSHMTGAAIEAAIERLVEQGALQRTAGARPVLSLSSKA